MNQVKPRPPSPRRQNGSSAQHLQDLRVAKQVPTPALCIIKHRLGFTYLLEASKAPCKLVYSLPLSCVVKVKRCASSACSTASYCKARNTTPCGRPAFADQRLACVSHHTSRRSSTRRSESPTRRSKVSTRRSGVSHKAQCATALVSAPVAHPVLAAVCSLFRCAASVLFLLHNPLNKNTPNRGQIWLFLVHYNRSNLIICYDEVQKLKQSGNH